MSESRPRANPPHPLLIAAAAAFSTYAFSKPFTATTYEGQQVFGHELKIVLVISQLAGYMLSKFIGIKIVSEMRSEHRAITIVGLILAAEAALVGFAYAPPSVKFVLPFFRTTLWVVAAGSILALLTAVVYFRRILPLEEQPDDEPLVIPHESATPIKAPLPAS